MSSLAVLCVMTAVLSPVPVTELVQCRPFDRHAGGPLHVARLRRAGRLLSPEGCRPTAFGC